MICSSTLTAFLKLRSRKTVRISDYIISADKYQGVLLRQMEAVVVHQGDVNLKKEKKEERATQMVVQ